VSQAGYGPATPQRKFPMNARAPFAFFEIVFRWSCIRVCEKVVDYFLLSFSSFCCIGVSSNVIITVKCRQLSLNWTWTIRNYVCGAHISLQFEPHFSKFNLTLKCFLHFVYQICFFHILLNIYFRALSINKSFRIINGKNISSGEKDTHKLLQAMISRPARWQRLSNNLLAG